MYNTFHETERDVFKNTRKKHSCCGRMGYRLHRSRQNHAPLIFSFFFGTKQYTNARARAENKTKHSKNFVLGERGRFCVFLCLLCVCVWKHGGH